MNTAPEVRVTYKVLITYKIHVFQKTYAIKLNQTARLDH